MNQVLRDLAARGVPTVAMADERTVRRNGKAAGHAGRGSRTIQLSGLARAWCPTPVLKRSLLLPG